MYNHFEMLGGINFHSVSSLFKLGYRSGFMVIFFYLMNLEIFQSQPSTGCACASKQGGLLWKVSLGFPHVIHDVLTMFVFGNLLMLQETLQARGKAD